ncbi:MAG: MFS transporter [Candidatus Poribacteria bacterium]|nr:MFS transporter [Candidatus Poribacteria bacterium]
MKESRQYEKRNFAVFAANQIFMRLGWIFKTESVIMPGFIDTQTSSDVVRGFLPLVSRIGQSVPQFLIARRLAQMPRKKVLFTLSAFGGMIPWLILAFILGFARWSSSVIVAVFLALYTLHWLTFGCNTLALGTLQGKLIRAERRGSLMAYSNIIGCTLAIVAAFFAMARWLQDDNTNYAWIFGATGLFFGLAAGVSLYFKEHPSPPPQQHPPFLKFLGSGLMLVRYDRDFRRLSIVLLLFYMSWPLFPHYTIFGKRTLGLVSGDFVTLVIVQNAVSGLGSWIMGHIADRRGNRVVMRAVIFIMACVPLLAVGISRLSFGAQIYWLVYACLGFTPVSGRIIVNYILEIAPQEKHPQYLAVMSLLQAVPLCGSPLLGLLIEKSAFEPVFIGGSAIIILSALLTFRLVEPRFSTSHP